MLDDIVMFWKQRKVMVKVYSKYPLFFFIELGQKRAL